MQEESDNKIGDEDNFYLSSSHKMDRKRSEDNINPVKSYMKSIGNFKVLTRQEEINLSTKIFEYNSEILRLVFSLPPAIAIFVDRYKTCFESCEEKSIFNLLSDMPDSPGNAFTAKEYSLACSLVDDLFVRFRTNIGQQHLLAYISDILLEISPDKSIVSAAMEELDNLESQIDVCVEQLASIAPVTKEVWLGQICILSERSFVDLWKTYARKNKVKVKAQDNKRILFLLKSLQSRLSMLTIDVQTYKDTKRKIKELQKKAQSAKDLMIKLNLKLVISYAKKRFKSYLPLQFLDLIQEGNKGLLRAVEKFNHRLGFKFSTYATWWIRQSVTRAIADQGKMIRIPVHMIETISKIKKMSLKMEEENKEATPEAISKLLKISPEKIMHVLSISRMPLSMEAPISKDSPEALVGDFIADSTHSRSPHRDSSLLNAKKITHNMLQLLSPREMQVICMRFGIKSGRKYTLEEVGKMFDVTRERIRQIEFKALKKLRIPMKFKDIKELI